ncbi:hypothetical protein JHK86_035524 [Glycine max]|nr:hypothetical protein JHK86_035524 [Glycine max]
MAEILLCLQPTLEGLEKYFQVAYVAVMRNTTTENRTGLESLLSFYRSSIASSADPNVVIEVLNLLLSDAIPDQDIIYVLAGISNEGSETAWKWLKDLIKTTLTVHAKKPLQFKVRAVVTVRNKIKEDFKETMLKHLDAINDSIGTRNVVLELISTEIDPILLLRNEISKEEQQSSWSKKSNVKAERVNYTTEFIVDSNFGVPGAITVTNKHQREFFLESITIEGFISAAVHFPCKSWVQGERIFFSNKVTNRSFSNLERSNNY